MRYTEAKEHTPGRLHELFVDPYHAFDNDSHERQLHIRVMLYLLAVRPMQHDLLTLRVIHGWENGGCEPADLKYMEYPLRDITDLHRAADEFTSAMKNNVAFPEQKGSLLAKPLSDAMADAKADGQPLDDETRARPARWPSFEGGLALYTLFKMYHRLVYGEDDAYRSSQCRTSQGIREIHEFHLEEGEFAFLAPPGRHFATERTRLILHESQLEPFKRLLIASAPLFESA
ncbi:hypothetical protein [Vreelandella salicampi]|uniref:Uncharacterized protein n=1 Tax=Vreelandella salicampi TaxID=1449798 RepID=A0A7Z0LIK3_9GAMM|nr:hypothetical protein [Halomonas salicampi]NYS59637.1 hypothetical protein [Halomonas salicampi]